MRDNDYREFFRMRRTTSLPIDKAAALLGITVRELRARTESGDCDATTSWEEIAYHIFLDRPRASLNGNHLPRDLRLVRVPWRLPRYVIRAMELQASRDVDDYVADVLHERIETSTVDALRNDHAFVEAFYYPY